MPPVEVTLKMDSTESIQVSLYDFALQKEVIIYDSIHFPNWSKLESLRQEPWQNFCLWKVGWCFLILNDQSQGS